MRFSLLLLSVLQFLFCLCYIWCTESLIFNIVHFCQSLSSMSTFEFVLRNPALLRVHEDILPCYFLGVVIPSVFISIIQQKLFPVQCDRCDQILFIFHIYTLHFGSINENVSLSTTFQYHCCQKSSIQKWMRQFLDSILIYFPIFMTVLQCHPLCCFMKRCDTQ